MKLSHYSWLAFIHYIMKGILPVLCPVLLWTQTPALKQQQSSNQSKFAPLYWINTAFENAAPMNWIRDSNGVVLGSLVYDHERSSTNQSNSHWHFQVQGRKGDTIPFVLQNFENIWNERPASPISDRSNCYVSADGINWKIISTEVIEGSRLKFSIPMLADQVYVASVPAYTQKNLDNLLTRIRQNKRIKITTIGKTVEGRPLEIIRVGDPNAPYRVFFRARAHGFEAGGNWVVDGLIGQLLKNDKKVDEYLKRFCVYILPMANKDAVARGKSRFNSQGYDLNRKWDKDADSILAPENHALEVWLTDIIKQGQRPHLAIDLHNDGYGLLHFSHPNVELDAYLQNMKKLEALLRQYTWFTEGNTGSEFRNPGSFGEGLMERFGIHALVYEFNYEWIEGLKKAPMPEDWIGLGEKLPEVLYHYFDGRVTNEKK